MLMVIYFTQKIVYGLHYDNNQMDTQIDLYTYNISHKWSCARLGPVNTDSIINKYATNNFSFKMLIFFWLILRACQPV